MRDGVSLLADRWYPADLDRAPVVLMRSPYERTGPFALMGRLFAERGFQLILQSCRGTGGSGGKLDPMRQEQADGLDTLDWIREQPWFAGRIYTFGLSYMGFAQWALAKQAGSRIDGMTLQVTLSNFRNETLAFGGFTQRGSMEWTALMNSLDKSVWARLRQRFSSGDFETAHNHLPLRELDRLVVGKEVSWWQDWLAHSDPADPWWAKIDHSADVEDITVPAAMIGGWRDVFLPWQVKDFEAMQAKGRQAWLTIGPWAHADVGAMAESVRQGLALFSAHSAGSRPFADRDRVRLYIVGADEWREYPAWPPPESHQARLYLQPGFKLAPVAPTQPSDATTFIYDPNDPTPAIHGPRLMRGSRKPDMSPLEQREDTVSFTSGILLSDMELIGPVSAELCVRSDREHTDFYICLCDVDRSGIPLHVVDGYLRLRPGQPNAHANGVKRITIECWPTAYRFRRGHRLRLIVASGAHPRYARNLGTGEPLATGTHMLAARQEILHDAANCSAICLTLGSPKDKLPA